MKAIPNFFKIGSAISVQHLSFTTESEKISRMKINRCKQISLLSQFIFTILQEVMNLVKFLTLRVGGAAYAINAGILSSVLGTFNDYRL